MRHATLLKLHTSHPDRVCIVQFHDKGIVEALKGIVGGFPADLGPAREARILRVSERQSSIPLPGRHIVYPVPEGLTYSFPYAILIKQRSTFATRRFSGIQATQLDSEPPLYFSQGQLLDVPSTRHPWLCYLRRNIPPGITAGQLAKPPLATRPSAHTLSIVTFGFTLMMTSFSSNS